MRAVQTYRGEPSLWQSPPQDYQPAPAPGGTTTFQLLLQDEDYSYDVVNNPIEIRDWRIPDEWPTGAKPVTRKIQYDDLYRVKRIDHEYSTGDDAWTSPFAPELGGSSDPRRAEPSPHVSFEKRILWQTFDYDWLGNSSKTDDDARGFYDRSLGTVTNDTANEKPYQLRSASNESLGGSRTGATDARHDAAGNLVRLDVKRNGSCLFGDCSQRFDYRWDEVGRLVRARRWDVTAASLTTPDAALPSDSEVDADLEYTYDANDDRVLKTARDGSDAVHTAYVFDSLELRRATFESGEYTQSVGSGAELAETEVPYLFAHGVRLARVVYEQVNDGEPRLASSGRQHVFFELGDHVGSTSLVLDKATSELVERGAFQAYGAKESDYRPDRWKGFREDYGFTGKEEDVEVGLTYFGKRFLSPHLGRWASADPLAVHKPGEADLNLYAYVRGAALKAIDPLGLDDAPATVKMTLEATDSGTNVTYEFSDAKIHAKPPSPALTDADKANDALGIPRQEVQDGFPTTEAVERGRMALPSETRNDPTLKPVGGTTGLNGWATEDGGTTRLLSTDGESAGYAGEKPLVPTASPADFLGPAAARGLWALGGRALRLGRAADDGARSSGLGDLTRAEVRQIQGVVDKAGRPLEVVGSAAKAERRGIGTDLPIGKGEGTRSDIDYMIPHGSAPYYEGHYGRLPSLDKGGPIFGTHNRFIGPAVRFEPGGRPYFVPGAH